MALLRQLITNSTLHSQKRQLIRIMWPYIALDNELLHPWCSQQTQPADTPPTQ